MKILQYDMIVNAVAELCIHSNICLPVDVSNALRKAEIDEQTAIGKSILGKCIDNARIAADEKIPICQDTGLAVFFIKIGDEIKIEGKSSLLADAINEGVRKGYQEGFLRKSVLSDPLYERKNTGDNTPAIIHYEFVKGENLDITVAPKGGGAENMSAIAMLPPSWGEDGVIRFVVETVVKGGGNPCPPTVVGVGIGGNFERCAYLAKKALIRTIGKSNDDSRYAALEEKILGKINQSGIGPQGLGGSVTSLAVHVEYEPCHLASLPVAVNINCHVHRHKSIVL